MIKTLAALVAALSVGTAVLLMMETGPARVEVPLPLRALDASAAQDELACIHQTDVAIQYFKWRNIIVHDAGSDGADVVRRCHFLIGSADEFGNGRIVPTRLWKTQSQGHHVGVPGTAFDSRSIGICVLCDARRAAPTDSQLASLIRLVQGLQHDFQIPPGRVSLHRDWDQTHCPGRHFPVRMFRDGLIPATR